MTQQQVDTIVGLRKEFTDLKNELAESRKQHKDALSVLKHAEFEYGSPVTTSVQINQSFESHNNAWKTLTLEFSRFLRVSCLDNYGRELVDVPERRIR